MIEKNALTSPTRLLAHSTTYCHSAGSQSVHIASYRVGFLGASEPTAPADPLALPPCSPLSPTTVVLVAAAVTGTPGGAPLGHTKARRLRVAARFGAFAGVCLSRFWPALASRHALHLER